MEKDGTIKLDKSDLIMEFGYWELDEIARKCVKHGDAAKLRVLIAAGLKVNIESYYGWTLAHSAAEGYSVEIMQALCDAGANLYVPVSPENMSTPSSLATNPKIIAVMGAALERNNTAEISLKDLKKVFGEKAEALIKKSNDKFGVRNVNEPPLALSP